MTKPTNDQLKQWARKLADHAQASYRMYQKKSAALESHAEAKMLGAVRLRNSKGTGSILYAMVDLKKADTEVSQLQDSAKEARNECKRANHIWADLTDHDTINEEDAKWIASNSLGF